MLQHKKEKPSFSCWQKWKNILKRWKDKQWLKKKCSSSILFRLQSKMIFTCIIYKLNPCLKENEWKKSGWIGNMFTHQWVHFLSSNNLLNVLFVVAFISLSMQGAFTETLLFCAQIHFLWCFFSMKISINFHQQKKKKQHDILLKYFLQFLNDKLLSWLGIKHQKLFFFNLLDREESYSKRSWWL